MYKAYKRPFYALIKHLGRGLEKKHFPDPPVYIGGCGRSGTTLLLSILSAHPEIFCCREELGLFERLREGKRGKEPLRLDRLYLSFLRYPIHKSQRRWCEKTPRNVRRFAQIDAYHRGRFQFIHMIRDGRDVVLSKHPDDPERHWVDPERWVVDAAAGREIANDPRVLTVMYEQLITDFEKEIRRICAFLNLAPAKEIIEWHTYAEVRQNRAFFLRSSQSIPNRYTSGKSRSTKNV